MLIFSTLFDHRYLSRGLALYHSLLQNCTDNFELYILATDDLSYNYLCDKKLDSVIIQSLSDIKKAYPILKELQKNRTRAEFSWTLSSFSIQFFINKFNLPSCTYIDADVYFFNNPQILFDEITTESVYITPHNFFPIYDQTAKSGRYCVQFMYFKNNEEGKKVLEWWRIQCEQCCCGKPTDNKFGDQKYLDDWLTRFPNSVKEAMYLGCGIAPWNVQKFLISKDNSSKLYITDTITKKTAPLIFYHFHELKSFIDKRGKKHWNLGNYNLNNNVVSNLYTFYINTLNNTENTDSIMKNCIPRESYLLILIKIFINAIIQHIKIFIYSFLFFKTIKNLTKNFYNNSSFD